MELEDLAAAELRAVLYRTISMLADFQAIQGLIVKVNINAEEIGLELTSVDQIVAWLNLHIGLMSGEERRLWREIERRIAQADTDRVN